MGFFDKKFETVAEILTPEQEQQLMSEIKASDEKRMVFFATVSAVLSIPLIVLDFIYFNQNLQKAYLVFDAALLIYSIIFLILTSLNATRHTVKTLKHLLFSSFPFFILAWATVISVIDQVSILNILAFYVPLFLIMFMLYSSLVRVLVYFIFILSVYFISSQFLERPYSSETFAMIIAGFVATTPFSLHFKRIRKNSNAVHLKLYQINQSLESEVDARTFELKKLNQDLELEIAQRKMAELQLRKALKLAEENDRLKSEFLANISHEIRTPLNAIIGFSQMIIDEGLDSKTKQTFNGLIDKNTFYLLSVIDDIFDASLIQSEQLKTINKEFSINSFISNIQQDIDVLTNKYEKTNLQIQIRFADRNDLKANTDEYLLRKAMIRLIDNAFKFTHRGGIEIGVNVMEQHIDFFVTDTGVGIPESERQKIFLPFIQGDGSYTRGYGGSGLGLAIVKGISDSLGCQVLLVSEINKGSCFTLRFNRESI